MTIGETERISLQFGTELLVLDQLAGLESLVNAAILVESIEVPFWGVLWPSGEALARALVLAGDLSGKRILELGCGVGAAGIVAAALGAEVVVSDIVPESVELALRNGKTNGVELEGLVLDWNEPPKALGSFDGIIASDVFYGDGMLRGVLRFIRRHLTDGGHAAVTDPMRVMDGGVAGACRLHGLACESRVLSPGQSITGGVTLYHLTRRPPPR